MVEEHRRIDGVVAEDGDRRIQLVDRIERDARQHRGRSSRYALETVRSPNAGRPFYIAGSCVFPDEFQIREGDRFVDERRAANDFASIGVEEADSYLRCDGIGNGKADAGGARTVAGDCLS